MTKTNITILGASGYTGVELIRLLSGHPHVRITQLIAQTNAGKAAEEVYAHLAGLDLPGIISLDQARWDDTQIVFCCLPHATTQAVISALPEHLTIIDLSADFRLTDVNAYQHWYGQPHSAPDLQQEAVYGLTEWAREAIKSARIIANPGCYPTASALPLMPLLKAGLIDKSGIIIDAKSGVTGAGRAAKRNLLFTEIDGGLSAYGIGGHRHLPEIEQSLSQAAGGEVHVTFTPHLVPMKRGILATIYVQAHAGENADTLRECIQNAYVGEPFVKVMPSGQTVSTHMTLGTNRCLIAVHADRIEGRVILTSVIDNLIKGASGQAVQNMNLKMGWAETLGLEAIALFP